MALFASVNNWGMEMRWRGLNQVRHTCMHAWRVCMHGTVCYCEQLGKDMETLWRDLNQMLMSVRVPWLI